MVARGAGFHQAQGQASVETLMLISMMVAVLVVMMVYMQRAYNGYLYASAASHGAPYDPQRPNQIIRRLNLRQSQDIRVKAGPRLRLPSGGDGLPSVSGGGVTGRIHATTASVTNEWDYCSRAAYGAGATPPPGCPSRDVLLTE